MDIEFIRQYCIKKERTTEEMPFGNDVLVFKVCGKIFALTGLSSWENNQPAINLKCDPDKAIELRATHAAIRPGYHMNKKHWNTIEIDETIHSKLVLELIDHSYHLVISKLPKKIREEFFN